MNLALSITRFPCYVALIMEANIQTNTPQGSPILAYGEVCPPTFGSPRHWFGILLACIVALCGLFVATLFFKIPFPEQVVALVVLHGKSPLSDPLPRIWQNTSETTSFPFIAGIVKQNGEWKSFTITFRGFGNAGAWTKDAGPFVLRSDSPLVLEQTTIQNILAPILKLGRHSAVLQINGDQIHPTFSGTLRGTIDGTTLTTDHNIHSPSSSPLRDGDIVANLNALPTSWPFIKESLASSGIPLDEMPSSIAWTKTTSSLPELDLFYDAGPSTGTILSLAVVAGQFDEMRIQLPDGSVAEELQLPTHVLTGTSSLRWDTSTGASIWIEGNAAHIQTGALRPHIPVTCPGRLLAQFSRQALQDMAERLNFPKESMRELQLVDQDGQLVVCWK